MVFFQRFHGARLGARSLGRHHEQLPDTLLKA
jgi:hypothetical protein